MNKRNIFILSIIILVLVSIFIVTRVYKNEELEKRGMRKVDLYFSTQDAMYLASERRTVNIDNLYLNTLKELIKGPESSSLNKTIPEGVIILDIKVKKGNIRINFNRALQKNHWGGSTGERMTVYSIVNTMTQFDTIQKVRILIEGKEIKTLVGHLDLTEPLFENKNLYK